MHLSADEQLQWQKNGYFVREAQFTPAELTELLQICRDVKERAHELAASGQNYWLDGKRFVDKERITIQFEASPNDHALRVVEPVHAIHPQIDTLLDDKRLKQPMTSLTGCEAMALWTIKLNLKPAGCGGAFRWHQDSPYWMHDHDDVDHLPNVMLTMTEQHRDNGCLRLIPGSHNIGILPGTNDGTQLGGFYTDPKHFDLTRAQDIEVAAGSLIFFSPHIVHGSSANRSALDRPALIATYQTANRRMLKMDLVRNIG